MQKNTGRTHFKGKGLGTSHSQRAQAVKLPPDLNDIVNAQSNKSEFLREAIREKAIRDGLLLDLESA